MVTKKTTIEDDNNGVIVRLIAIMINVNNNKVII